MGTIVGSFEFVSESKTSTYSVLVSDAGKIFDNTGATSQVNFNLPSAAANLGPFTFLNLDADSLRVNASAGDTIRISSSVSSVAGYAEPTTPSDFGQSVTLFAKDTTQWIAINGLGTWTVT